MGWNLLRNLRKFKGERFVNGSTAFSLCRLKVAQDSQRQRSPLWPGFVNYVEGRFRSSAETTEPGRAYNLLNSPLAGLGT
jgi:hypothetical protein